MSICPVGMPKEDLKKLPPEERIKRLKQLEEEKKREIEEAHQGIRESEEEIKEERKWKEKVPIPEVAQDTLENLSEGGKELLRVHKGVRKNAPKEDDEKKPSKIRKQGEGGLEEAVEKEKTPPLGPAMMDYGQQQAAAMNIEYTLQLSRRPVSDLYKEMSDINRSVQEKGYLSSEQERRVEYLTGAVEEKFKAVEDGRYSFSEDAARAASLTQQIGTTMQNVYKKDKGSAFEHDWYKGR